MVDKRVFLSVSHALSSEQEMFVAAVEALLNQEGVRSLTIGRNMEKSATACRDIAEAIESSLGVMVIAMKRMFVYAGRQCGGEGHREEFSERYYPSVWNQIEAAMTLHAQRPLFLMHEVGVTLEGVFTPSVLTSIPFSPPSLTPDLRDTLCDWLTSLDISSHVTGEIAS
jgi:hypothetical protein